MRNVLRLGLAAAAIGSVLLAPGASADNCPLWIGSDSTPAAVAVCTPEPPGSIPVFYGGGTEVCHRHLVDVWVRYPDGSKSFVVNAWQQTIAGRLGSQARCTPDLTQ